MCVCAVDTTTHTILHMMLYYPSEELHFDFRVYILHIFVQIIIQVQAADNIIIIIYRNKTLWLQRRPQEINLLIIYIRRMFVAYWPEVVLHHSRWHKLICYNICIAQRAWLVSWGFGFGILGMYRRGYIVVRFADDVELYLYTNISNVFPSVISYGVCIYTSE